MFFNVPLGWRGDPLEKKNRGQSKLKHKYGPFRNPDVDDVSVVFFLEQKEPNQMRNSTDCQLLAVKLLFTSKKQGRVSPGDRANMEVINAGFKNIFKTMTLQMFYEYVKRFNLNLKMH